MGILNQVKNEYHVEDYLLEQIPHALVLGLDEVDCVFQIRR